MPVGSGCTPLAEVLSERIRAAGPITFAEFMEACLYHPDLGYYMKPDLPARRDYYTSVDVGPIFGRLLARQFYEMWIELDRPAEFQLVELGAGSGILAQQVLDFAAAELGEFYETIRYAAVERSAARRAAQAQLLRSHIIANKCELPPALPDSIPFGCIFSNEFFDALPVHRVIQEKNEMREICVGLKENEFCDVRHSSSSPAISQYFAIQEIGLQEEQQAEVGLEAGSWIEKAGAALQRGFVLTMDYGHEARELYDARHMRGTLLAYARHRASEEFYRAPGQQDLTAHVNFTALDCWGRRGGLARTGFATQTNFLLSLVRHAGFRDLEPEGKNDAEKARARLSFKTLIHPEGMGETFQILIQHKGIESPRLGGLEPL